MSDETYQGYKNFETWTIALHLDNTYASHMYWTERANELLDNDNAVFVLASEIQESLAAHPLDDDVSVFSSLLNSALSRVNWYEVAERFVETAKENLAYAETQKGN